MMAERPRSNPVEKQGKGHRLNELQQKKIKRYPCDGVPRFSHGRSKYPKTYSEVYREIFAETYCYVDDDGAGVFTPKGIAQLAKLNDSYSRIAASFIARYEASGRKKFSEDVLATLDSVLAVGKEVAA